MASISTPVMPRVAGSGRVVSTPSMFPDVSVVVMAIVVSHVSPTGSVMPLWPVVAMMLANDDRLGVEAEQKKVIREFADNKDVQVLNGRYGPYIKIGKKNHKIPKDAQPEDLSLEDCLKIAGKSKKDSDKK